MELQLWTEDQLLCHFEPPLRSLYYQLGFPVEVVTNSREVLAGAEESWANFRAVFSGPPMQIRIGVPERCSSAWFERVVCYGEEDARTSQKASLRNLFAVGAFELRYNELASAALPLESLVREGPSIAKEPSVHTGDFQSA